MYVVSFLDRANISFAKAALEKQIGISPQVYALAAGLFFLSYAAFEIPSNLILHRVGAKLWMARIMVTWGVVSMGTMFVQGSRSFYFVRLLLGAAEAGFFPGVILYLTYWFPRRERARIFGLFYFGAPLAFIVGGPISGLLLQISTRGQLQGWQWMFLVEGLMAVVIGIWSYFYLDDGPTDAQWLSTDERRELRHAFSIENIGGGDRLFSIGSLFKDRRLLHFVAIYFFIQVSVYGVVFYLPSEVSAILHRPAGFVVGLVSALPWLCALVGTFMLTRLADSTGKQKAIAASTLLIAGCASLIFSIAGAYVGLISLCIAATGYIAVQPLFWTFPTSYLSDSAAAAGLAMINALGSAGGFFAPNIKVWSDTYFSSNRAGLFVLGGAAVLNAVFIALIRQRPSKILTISGKV